MNKRVAPGPLVRKVRGRGGAAALLLALAGAGSGCTQDFPPFNRLESLRVLGIQAEPAAPLTGESTTLTPLVHTPGDATALTYQWSWCPAPGPSEQGYRCLITEEELAAALGGGGMLPPFDLGTNPTATLQNALPPEALAAICGGLVPGVPSPNCAGGYPIQVRLDVTNESETVQSVVTVKMRFDGATQAANANPTISGITAVLNGGEPIPVTEILDGDTVTLPRKKATRLVLSVPAEDSETFAGLDETGQPKSDLRERLFITWFVETGSTDDPRTSYIPDRTPLEDMLKNTWSPAESRLYAGNTARLYVVIHDSRGGLGWRSGIVQLEPNP